MPTLKIEFMQDLLDMFNRDMRDEADQANWWLTNNYGPSGAHQGRYTDGLQDERAPWHKKNPHLIEATAAWRQRDPSRLGTVNNVDDIGQVTVMFKRVTHATAEAEYRQWKDAHGVSREEHRVQAITGGSVIHEMLDGDYVRMDEAHAPSRRPQRTAVLAV